MRSIGGFTLLELMITLAVAGVLAAVALPSFTGMVRNNRLTAQANDLVSALSLARSEAMKRGMFVTVCRSNTPTAATPACGGGTGWEKGWVIFIDRNNNGTIEAADGDRNGDGTEQAREDRDGTVGAFAVADVILQTHAALTGSNTLRGGAKVADRVTFNPQGMSPVSNDVLTLCDGKKPKFARTVTLMLTGRAEMLRYDGGFSGSCS